MPLAATVHFVPLLSTLVLGGTVQATGREASGTSLAWWQRAAGDQALVPVLLPRPHGGSHNFTLAYGGWSGTPASFNATADTLTAVGIANGIGALEHEATLYDAYAARGWPVDFYTKFSSCFQVKHCPNNLSSADAAALQILETANIFHSSSLAEWGYSFHSLQWQGNMGWWHAVLPNLTNTSDPPGCTHPPNAPHPGASSCRNTNSSLFERLYKEDATPKGMAGYWRYPSSRKEARDYVKQYFDERKASIANLKPGKFHSITCISHYEMYAASWGVDMIGLELGCQHNQASLAMARSGSRRTGKPTYASMMTWFGPAMCGCCGNSSQPDCTLNVTGPGFSTCTGEQAGHSSSLLKRMWAHAWWSGIGEMVMDSAACYFWKNCSHAQGNVLDYTDSRLSVHGQNAAELYTISSSRERGTPLTPIGIVADELLGWTADFGYTYASGSVPGTGNGSSWGILPSMEHDSELDDLLNAQLFAAAPDGSKQSGTWTSTKNETEFLELRPTPHGEIADVQLSDANATVLARYPVLILAGDMPSLSDPLFQKAMANALMMEGGTEILILRPHHIQALGAAGLVALNRSGKVELSNAPPLTRTKRAPAISDKRLGEISTQYLPVQVHTTPSAGQRGLLWQVNGLPDGVGWAIELSNPNGVVKTSCTPMTLDVAGAVTATLISKKHMSSAVVWEGKRNKPLTIGSSGLTIAVTVPPGAVMFIEAHLA